MADAAKIIELRQLLKERFPAAHSPRPPDAENYPTGIPSLDEAGIPKGHLTELVSGVRSGGSALLLRGLIEQQTAQGQLPALIDGRNSFDPQDLSPAACRRLLWIRCHNARESLQAADILLRDGNLPLVVLDLQFNPRHEFRRIPAPTWHRLQSLVARTRATCLIMTPIRLVSSARLRLTLNSLLQVESLERPETGLRNGLQLEITRRRGGVIEEPAALRELAG
ncbi:MAG: hypothetical protein ISQ14_10365 [Verrucomicrobiae bacterium]|nr:hypothetical protein [Verrucomicrobiae bacterium]